MAKRVLAGSATGDRERIAQIHLLALARPPLPAEISRAEVFLAGDDVMVVNANAQTPGTAGQAREARWTSYCQSVLAAAEFRVLR